MRLNSSCETCSCFVRIRRHKAEKGRIGERYLLAGTNLSMQEVFRRIARSAGRPLSFAVAAPAEAAAWVKGKEALFAWDLGKLTGWYAYYDSGKAERELDYRRTPLESTLSRILTG